jgi:hypothetical protein
MGQNRAGCQNGRILGSLPFQIPAPAWGPGGSAKPGAAGCEITMSETGFPRSGLLKNPSKPIHRPDFGVSHANDETRRFLPSRWRIVQCQDRRDPDPPLFYLAFITIGCFSTSSFAGMTGLLAMLTQTWTFETASGHLLRAQSKTIVCCILCLFVSVVLCNVSRSVYVSDTTARG